MKKALILILTIVSLCSYGQTKINTAGSNSVANINTAISGSITASGTDTYTATVTNLTWASGDAMDITFTNANTGSSTFQLNGGTTYTLKKFSSGSLVNLASGDISAGERKRFYNNGTYLIVEGGSGSGGTSGLVIGTTTITGGTTTRIPYNNAGVLGEYNISGSGSVAMTTSPVFTTPNLGVPSAADFSTGSFTWPTFNQNTTGSATTLTTSRTIGTVTGDATSAGSAFNGSANNTNAITVTKINGTSLAGLATGILKNTTSTGVPSIAVAGDFPTLNQNTTGSSGSVANALTVDNSSLQLNSGTTYDGSAARTISVKNLGITNSMLAGSIDLTSKVTGLLPDGNISSASTWNAKVTNVTITQPAAGITVTNSGVAQAPTPTFTVALANDLAGLEGLSSTGIPVRTATDTWAQRTITGTSNQITVTNGDGVSGNPTLSLPSSLVLPNGTTATTQSANDNSTKPATTAYVDNAVLGQRTKEAVKYASTAALPSIVYSNGASGVGATLTGVALAAISLDGSSPSLNDRVLIKNQASTFQNGLYTVTQTGSGIAVFILTRATDFDQAADIQTGDNVFVTSGSTLGTTTWTYNASDNPVMGTDAITFVQIAGQGSFTGGNGITITGVSIAIDPSVTVDKTTTQTISGAKTFSTAPNFSGLTASQILATDGSKNVQTLTTATYPSLTELSYVKGITSAAQNQFDSKSDKATAFNIQTGNYTLVLTDKDSKTILMRSTSAQSLTIPPNSSVAFPKGTQIVITQDSTGVTTVVAGAGVAIESSSLLLTSRCQDSPMVLEKKNDTDSWYLWNGLPTPTIDLTANVTGILPVANGGTGVSSVSSTYTPTLNNTTNVAASTAHVTGWFRVGNMVTVFGEVDIDPTTTGTLTVLGISLPVPSSISNSFELAGTSANELGDVGRVAGDAANDRAYIRVTPVSVTNDRYSFQFSYQVL